jgi:outer membrane protein OmpA-like peptidoglycan-associated protein
LGDQVRGLNVYAGMKIAIPYTRPRAPKPLPVDSPITKIDTPIVKVDTPIVKIDTPIVKIDTPIVKIDTPIVKIDTPIVKIDTPIVKIDTPIVKIDTPIVKVDTPIVKVDTPAVKIDSPQIAIKPVEPRPTKVDTTEEAPLPVPTDSKRYKYQGHEYVIQPFELTLADNSVYFATGSAEISKKEALKLDTLVMNMQKIKNSRILAHGYADTIGSNKLNEQLSQRRAVSIQNYLVKKGIAKDRILIDAFGAARPVEDNRTEQGRRLNRRVEIFLLLQESIKVNKADKPK